MEQTNQLVVLYMCIKGCTACLQQFTVGPPGSCLWHLLQGGKQMRDLCVSARPTLRAARGNTTEIKASNGWEKTSEATAQRRQRERNAMESVRPSPRIGLTQTIQRREYDLTWQSLHRQVHSCCCVTVQVLFHSPVKHQSALSCCLSRDQYGSLKGRESWSGVTVRTWRINDSLTLDGFIFKRLL